MLFEREARSPDDRPINKNPDHALGASCCECFQESQRTESTKEIDKALKQGIFKDDFHQNAQSHHSHVNSTTVANARVL